MKRMEGEIKGNWENYGDFETHGILWMFLNS